MKTSTGTVLLRGHAISMTVRLATPAFMYCSCRALGRLTSSSKFLGSAAVLSFRATSINHSSDNSGIDLVSCGLYFACLVHFCACTVVPPTFSTRPFDFIEHGLYTFRWQYSVTTFFVTNNIDAAQRGTKRKHQVLCLATAANLKSNNSWKEKTGGK